MCQQLNFIATEALRKNTAQRVAYKLIQSNSIKGLHSQNYPKQCWAPGEIVSDRVSPTLTENEKANNQVCHGIHVHFIKPAPNSTYRILEVGVSSEDLLSFNGQDHAVYNKVTVTEQAFWDACVVPIKPKG